MSEADIWRLVRLAGVRDGHVMPQTPEEVAEAERHFDETRVELPPSLLLANMMKRIEEE
jgi:vacuolar-type H+-ATPase subunit F/Vma7